VMTWRCHCRLHGSYFIPEFKTIPQFVMLDSAQLDNEAVYAGAKSPLKSRTVEASLVLETHRARFAWRVTWCGDGEVLGFCWRHVLW
jgi:hypothetical protein